MSAWKQTSWMFGALVLVVALGQGCLTVEGQNTENDQNTGANTDTDTTPNNDTNTNTDNNNNDPDDSATAPCPTGTVRFTSTRANLTFCYPQTVSGQAVTVEDGANRVVIRVGNETARVIAVESIDAEDDRREKVLEYAADPVDTTITCEAQSLENREGREVYTIIGRKSGTQTQVATDACLDSTKLNTALDDEPAGRFYFYTGEDVLIVLSTSQDAVLGQMTDEFEGSLQPKE